VSKGENLQFAHIKEQIFRLEKDMLRCNQMARHGFVFRKKVDETMILNAFQSFWDYSV